MIGVCQHHLGTSFLQILGIESLDRAARAYRHERRRGDGAVQCVQDAAPGGPVCSHPLPAHAHL